MPTQVLALIFSGYMIVAALKILIDPEWYLSVVNGLRETPAVSFLCGVFIYFLGAILMALHWDFSSALSGFVTVFAALMAMEGLAIMLVPSLILAVPAGIGFQHHSRGWGVFALAFGVGFLIWALI